MKASKVYDDDSYGYILLGTAAAALATSKLCNKDVRVLPLIPRMPKPKANPKVPY